eukprot:NODE_9261_length_1436_cov_5.907563.p1 GENE.NODE_9261_length_1436_cov_5.907563~~NODE_9261_length_1436_cov_5.907563.p1  ORF type:complete len:281 (+),score=73.02 NODE_9261_length_1436_cov_5.907563:274-1116(+)
MGSLMLLVMFFFMHVMIYVIVAIFCFGGGVCTAQIGSATLQTLWSSSRRRAGILPVVGPVAHADVIAGFIATCIVCTWFVLRNSSHAWPFQDLIGAAFLVMIQRTLRLPNIKVATILLTTMFFFDIFWVFLSPLLFHKSVMVEVAKGGGTGETVPMLLRVPAINDPFGSDRMLGFGDVALPGLLISFLHRLDVSNRLPTWSCDGYFLPSVIGYFMGLIATLCALAVMRMGQPALLYLVPGTLGTTLALGWRRQKLSLLWRGLSADRSQSLECVAEAAGDL